MSLDIDWSLLSSPSTSTSSELTTHLITLLNNQLSTTSRPSFIGPISVTSFEFGSVGPDVEIRDIRDVWRAFDEADEDEDDLDGPRGAEDEEGDGEDEYEFVDGWEVADEGVGEGEERSVSGRGSVTAVGIGVDHLGPRPQPRARHHRRVTGTRPGRRAVPPLRPDSPDKTKTETETKRKDDGSHQTLPSLQLHLHLTHLSDLHLTLLTSLQVNYPSPLFMSLPLKLSITGLTLTADVILAYSGDRHRVHLCVVDDDGGGLEGTGQRLLPHLQIESEIGHADAHVLRNVGKVERFIADVVRKTLVDELVFPNFHTIAL